MKTLFVIGIIAAALSALGLALNRNEERSDCDLPSGLSSLHPGATPELEAELIGQEPSRYPAFYGRFQAYIGEGVIQYYDFGANYDAADPTHLVIYNDAPGLWYDILEQNYDESYDFSASFEIVTVQARTRDHFYVAGRSGSEDIIERWKKAPVKQVGGPTGYVMKRVQLYRGALGGIRCIGADHLGRYLLVLHGSSPVRLSRMPLPSGGTPTELYTSLQIPEMASSQYSLFPRRHSTEGVVWTLEDIDPLGPGEYVLFRDSQDDGTMDSWGVYSNGDYFDTYGASSSTWTDWFMSD